RGGSGNGQCAVGPFFGAPADVERGAGEFFNYERLEADASADDVNDRGDGAGFVGMDFFERDGGGGGLGFAELGEDGGSAVADGGLERRFLQDVQDRGEGAVLGLVFGGDFDVSRGHAVLPDFFGGELPAGDVEAMEGGTELVDGEAGI